MSRTTKATKAPDPTDPDAELPTADETKQAEKEAEEVQKANADAAKDVPKGKKDGGFDAADPRATAQSHSAGTVGEGEPISVRTATPGEAPAVGTDPVSNDDWAVVKTGRGLIEVRPHNWVGEPPLVFPASKLDSLKKALGKI